MSKRQYAVSLAAFNPNMGLTSSVQCLYAEDMATAKAAAETNFLAKHPKWQGATILLAATEVASKPRGSFVLDGECEVCGNTFMLRARTQDELDEMVERSGWRKWGEEMYCPDHIHFAGDENDNLC